VVDSPPRCTWSSTRWGFRSRSRSPKGSATTASLQPGW
jgi:hypothetical protein